MPTLTFGSEPETTLFEVYNVPLEVKSSVCIRCRFAVGRFPLRWDTLVGDVMGSKFRFADELRTRQTTIRDLLAHRTGLPSYKMALMVGLEPAHSRQDYCLYVLPLFHVYARLMVLIVLSSDVNKDWTCKDKDKDQAYKDQDKDKD